MAEAIASIRVKMADNLGTPSAPIVSGATSSTIDVSWSTLFGANYYVAQHSLDGITGWTTILTTPGLNAQDVELLPNTLYYYRYRGEADGGRQVSPWSAVASMRTTTTASPPATPAAPTVAGGDTSSQVVSWIAVPGATSYTLQSSLTGTGDWVTETSGSPDLSYPDTGLPPGTRVYYRVSATGPGGTSGYSPNGSGTTAAAGSGNVIPFSARKIVRRTGVAAHPNFNTANTVWKADNANAFCAAIAAKGFTFIRGGMAYPAVADKWADACRANGIGWLISPVGEGSSSTTPTGQSLADTTAEVRRIRDNYADICVGIEGPNEPQHNRSGAPVVSDWATNAAYGVIPHMRAIWNAARDPLASGAPNPLVNIPIVASSLQDLNAEASYTAASPAGGARHWHQMAYGTGSAAAPNGLIDAQGNLRYCTQIGLHTYPGGAYPLRKLDSRLGYLRDAFPGAAVWCTEHGWHNALNTTRGHVPITEAGAGVYGIRGVLEFITTCDKVGGGTDLDRGEMRYTYFEGLDDSQTLTEHEQRFGLLGVGSGTAGSGLATDPANSATWRIKPVMDGIGTLLLACQDPPGTAAYTPTSVTCTITCSVTGHNLWYKVVANRAQSDLGTATLWIWREKEVWDRDLERTIAVGKVDITVVDRVGRRDFTGTDGVDASVKRIELR